MSKLPEKMMKMSDQAQEPSMEELLATIRRIVADDDQPHPTAPKSGPREPRLATDAPRQPGVRIPAPVETPAPAPASVAPSGGEALEMEILELTEEFLVSEDDGGFFAEGAQEDYEPPHPGRRLPADLDRPLMAEGERRVWDEQPPINASPRPAAEPSLPPADRAGDMAPQTSAQSHYTPRRPVAAERERPPMRPAWSARDLTPPRPAPAGDHAARRPSPPASETPSEPASLWQSAPENETWPDNVQIPVPPSGPAAPFPIAEQGSAPGLHARQESPRQQAALEPSAGRAYTAATVSSRIAAPVTGDGSAEFTPASLARRAAPAGTEPGPEANEPPAAPRYVQDMAQKIARAAISGLGDKELAQANRPSLAAEKGAALAGVAASLAHALTERAVTPEAMPEHGDRSDPVQAKAEAAAAEAVAPEEPQGQPQPVQTQARKANLEESFKELLRPMLEEWLNENMPRLLEEAIAEEVRKRLGGA